MDKLVASALFIAAIATGALANAAAPDHTDRKIQTEPSCVLYDVDGTCLVNSREAKGNDHNYLLNPEIMADFCANRATTRNELRWCEQLGF
ncbi:hypothetical protein GCM10022280_17930 [Sphingomonas swuensis]|uniref:Uncharacterized protein n=1 Tax=Sphingomonas swuensis TaxID=977800 RepID=A0ABP7SZG8_9SPHN